MIALTFALLLAGTPCTLPPLAAEPRPFRTGEALTYDLEIAFVKAGRLALQVDRPMRGGAVLPLKARAQTSAAVANVKRITAVALSWIDATTVRPERYHEETDEDGVRRSTDARLAPPAATVTLEQRWKDQRTPKSFPRLGEPLDALSALYFLRAARLAPGDRFCLDLVAAGRLWRVTGEVAKGRERVETPAGRFDTVRLDFEGTRADAPAAKKRAVHVWITADGRRLPVSIVSEIDAGPVSAMLTAFHPAPAR